MELDPKMVVKIVDRARADRAIVDRYNANLLRAQGIEPTAERLQAMCDQNMEVALVAEAQRKRLSNQ